MQADLHRWDVTPREAVAIQRELVGLIRLTPLQKKVQTISAADCAFIGKKRILAAAVLCNAKTLEILDSATVNRPLMFPYVPGLLSFREAPAVIEAVSKLRTPGDVLMIDGQGIAHPRGVGLASHVGLWLNVPTIGVAKSRLCGSHRPVGQRRGNRSQLVLDGKVIGVALRTRDNVSVLYVSPGHLITLGECIRLVLRCAPEYRLPQPSKLAHNMVSMLKSQLVD